MLSVESLQKYLSNNDNNDEIDSSITFILPESINNDNRHIYDKYVLESKFSLLDKKIEKLSSEYLNFLNIDDDLIILKDNDTYNTFILSILNIIFPDFRYFDKKSKIKFIKDLLNQMAYDLQEKNLYSYFNYNKNHSFSRTEFAKYLNLHENVDKDSLSMIRQ